MRRDVPVAAVSAGSNGESAKLSFDDDETTSWASGNDFKNGWIEYQLARPADLTLERKVGELELKVEERKKVLSALAKAKGPIDLNPDGAPPPDETPEEAAKKAKAAQDYEDARREG